MKKTPDTAVTADLAKEDLDEVQGGGAPIKGTDRLAAGLDTDTPRKSTGENLYVSSTGSKIWS